MMKFGFDWPRDEMFEHNGRTMTKEHGYTISSPQVS